MARGSGSQYDVRVEFVRKFIYTIVPADARLAGIRQNWQWGGGIANMDVVGRSGEEEKT
jgi:hypothetical protein